MTLLIARAAHELPRTQAFFARYGFSCFGLPVSTTVAAAPKTLRTPLLMVTSAAAVPYLTACAAEADKIACVGEHTAEVLRAAGFNPALVGASDGESLAEEIIQNFAPCRGVHVAGDQAITDWHGTLVQAGFEVGLRQAYTTRYADVLPLTIQQALQKGLVQQVLLFSAQGAAHTLKLLQKSGVTPPVAVCLSAQVAKAWQGAGLTSILAEQPTLASLLAAVKKGRSRG
jgi:uroporphyrinogen-III synthase